MPLTRILDITVVRPLSGRLLGYARVSTDGQSLAAQLDQLHAAWAARVFRETASGAKRDRAQLAKLLREVDHGDVVVVTRRPSRRGPPAR